MSDTDLTSRDQVERRVRRVVADVLGVEPEEIGPAVSLVDDLAADSLDLVDIGLALEGALGVSMPDQVLEGVRTYDDLMAAVCRAQGKAGTSVPVTSALGEGRPATGDAAEPPAAGDSLPAEGAVAALERTFGRLRALAAVVSLAREQRAARNRRSDRPEKDPRAARAPG